MCSRKTYFVILRKSWCSGGDPFNHIKFKMGAFTIIMTKAIQSFYINAAITVTLNNESGALNPCNLISLI